MYIMIKTETVSQKYFIINYRHNIENIPHKMHQTSGSPYTASKMFKLKIPRGTIAPL